MFRFNVATRVVYNRNNIKYLGQIIDARKGYDSNEYLIKFDNTHTFCHHNYNFNKTM